MVPKKIKSKQNQVARFQVESDARKARLLAQGVSEDRIKKDSMLRHLKAEIRKAKRVITAYEAMLKAKEAPPPEKPAKGKGKEGKAAKAPKGEAKPKGEKPPKQKKVKEPAAEAAPAETPAEKAE
jgi:hypothetical protein